MDQSGTDALPLNPIIFIHPLNNPNISDAFRSTLVTMVPGDSDIDVHCSVEDAVQRDPGINPVEGEQ